MPTTEERLDELTAQVAKIDKDLGVYDDMLRRRNELIADLQSKVNGLVGSQSASFDWSKLTAYLPTLKSWLIAAAFSAVGSGGMYLGMPTPAPKEVPAKVDHEAIKRAVAESVRESFAPGRVNPVIPAKAEKAKE